MPRQTNIDLADDLVRHIHNPVPGRQDMQYGSIVQNQCKCIDILENRKYGDFRRPDKFHLLLNYIMPPYTVVILH